MFLSLIFDTKLIFEFLRFCFSIRPNIFYSNSNLKMIASEGCKGGRESKRLVNRESTTNKFVALWNFYHSVGTADLLRQTVKHFALYSTALWKVSKFSGNCLHFRSTYPPKTEMILYSLVNVLVTNILFESKGYELKHCIQFYNQ